MIASLKIFCGAIAHVLISPDMAKLLMLSFQLTKNTVLPKDANSAVLSWGDYPMRVVTDEECATLASTGYHVHCIGPILIRR